MAVEVNVGHQLSVLDYVELLTLLVHLVHLLALFINFSLHGVVYLVKLLLRQLFKVIHSPYD